MQISKDGIYRDDEFKQKIVSNFIFSDQSPINPRQIHSYTQFRKNLRLQPIQIKQMVQKSDSEYSVFTSSFQQSAINLELQSTTAQCKQKFNSLMTELNKKTKLITQAYQLNPRRKYTNNVNQNLQSSLGYLQRALELASAQDQEQSIQLSDDQQLNNLLKLTGNGTPQRLHQQSVEDYARNNPSLSFLFFNNNSQLNTRYQGDEEQDIKFSQFYTEMYQNYYSKVNNAAI